MKTERVPVWILVTVLLLISLYLPAQVTKIMGKVTDASTGEPLPFTNVVVSGTTLGTLTDFEGI